MADQNGKGAPPRAPAPSLRKVGPQSAEPVGSLAREDYLLAMPDPEFESWVDSRLSGAYGTPGEQDEFRAVEADRRLRAWARDGGEPAGARKPLADLGSESPIEAMLLEAFFASGFFERFEVPSDVVVGSGPFGLLLQQVTVPSIDKRYRLDFAIIDAAESLYLAVEVDGHQWHEATPHQVQSDKSRDRKLTAAGWQVLRFTGSEVYRNAAACVREVRELIARKRAGRMAG
jgi:very-short-patch-repair endonuclease